MLYAYSQQKERTLIPQDFLAGRAVFSNGEFEYSKTHTVSMSNNLNNNNNNKNLFMVSGF